MQTDLKGLNRKSESLIEADPMADDKTHCLEFRELEVKTSTCDGIKEDRQLSASQRKNYSLCRRKAFGAFVATKRNHSEEKDPSWCCCGQLFNHHSAIHKHVSRTHDDEIQQVTKDSYKTLFRKLEERLDSKQPYQFEAEALKISTWIPNISHVSKELKNGPGKVLLYYHYCEVKEPHVICEWQKTLCEKLHLSGKIRVATEGINGTVGGTNVATEIYVEAMCSHPLLKMEKNDFKSSDGGAECFTELKVGVFKEIVPMGVDPDVLSYQQAGVHLEPEEFHKEVEALLAKGARCDDTILLDCRNFYESKIGHFSQCLAPDIRKFSYFPDYVDQNLELFRDKKVLMYCTGGIRCERGSAYLCSKTADTVDVHGTATNSVQPGSAASWFCLVRVADRMDTLHAASPVRPKNKFRVRPRHHTKRSVSAPTGAPESLRMCSHTKTEKH